VCSNRQTTSRNQRAVLRRQARPGEALAFQAVGVRPADEHALHAEDEPDKVNLDIFWLRDKSLEESDDLADPDMLAQEIADDMQTALEQFSAIAEKVRA
jgi:hypothetical protein